MRITKRQLRRIIKEEKRKLLNEGASGAEIQDSILRALGMTSGGMTGIDLIDHVRQELPGAYHQRIEEYMDEMLDSGLLSWNVEEDEWRLA